MSSEFALSPPRKRPMDLLRLVGWAVALAFLVWSWRGAEMRPMTLITESGNILTLIKDFFPPDFTDWRLYATEMVVTLQVAIWGTLLAVLLRPAQAVELRRWLERAALEARGFATVPEVGDGGTPMSRLFGCCADDEEHDG